jgi:hypothetical protein
MTTEINLPNFGEQLMNPTKLTEQLMNPTKTTPSCIIRENVQVNDPRSIATIMNDYFSSIGSTLANKI